MLKAVIVDDEPDCVRLLTLQLNMYCKQVQIVAACTSAVDGVQKIKEHQPDVVFLDIEMPFMNGFQVLENLGDIDFSLIFVTAYDRFAVRAFRFSALDYLLKPIDAKDLISAVEKAVLRKVPHKQQLNLLRKQMQEGEKSMPDKIALPFQNGVTFAEIKKVIYCESDNNYTKFHLEGKLEYTIAKTLGSVQEILHENGFVRVHRQYLVNMNHITKFVRGQGCYLVMSNGQTISVARNQKEKLMEKFGWI